MDFNLPNQDPSYALKSKEPLGSRESAMEINNHFSLNKKEVLHSPPIESALINRDLAIAAEQQLQQQLLTLKQQQQLQQQMLLQQFQAQQQQLAHEHDKQIQEHMKCIGTIQQQEILYARQMEQWRERQQEFLERQEKEVNRREQQRCELEKLRMIKNKKKDEESAVASTEVKLRLQEFVLKKKQQEAAMTNMRNSPPQLRQWAAHHSSIDQQGSPPAGLSPPYHPRILGAYEDDFPPLRKTASEPNLKVRSVLKQKVIERRSSPLLKRKEKALLFKRKPPFTTDPTLSHSNPDSGPNSPPSGVSGQQSINVNTSNGSLSNIPAPELIPGVAPINNNTSSDINNLYTSPSMPNISLGKPCAPTSSSVTSSASEAELRAMAAARFGLPLTGHMLSSSLPFYPSLPVIDGEVTPPTSPAYITAQMKALEAQGQTNIPGKPSPTLLAITGHCLQESNKPSHPRLRHRPLERTHSAPLPLGNPLLQQQLLQQQQEQLKEHQKKILKQHIRQTVLHRAGSKSHMENVDEETEAKLAQEMKEGRDNEEEVAITREKPGMTPPAPPVPPVCPAGDISQQQQQRRSFLIQQQQELLATSAAAAAAVNKTAGGFTAGTPIRPAPPRPLSRTHSSPLVTFSLPPQPPPNAEPVKLKFTTGLVYDSLMLKHQCTCGNNANHPEHAGRLQSIWARLQETRLADRCEKIKSRKATIEELQLCHSEAYSLLYGTNPHNRLKLDPKLLESLPLRFCLLPCGGIGCDSDTVWNEIHTSHVARMAAGCVTELALKVGAGELKNGMAIVRPPGHHAEFQQPMGFCFFNSIAIAAKQLRERLKFNKILIIDWDVHHGNGTQQMFYDDPNVLYLSVHRHDNGNFFPGTGAFDECGCEQGIGFNVNLAFSGAGLPMSDAEYLAVFRTVLMPIARAYNPDMILVSSGFDAAIGHPQPLGGYTVSPACFGHMTRQLMTLAGGKVVLALEGGYDLAAICDASEICVQALLGDEIPPLKEDELRRSPHQAAVESIERTIRIQGEYWPCVLRYVNTIHYSYLDAQKLEREEADTVTALASLSMVHAQHSLSDTGSSLDSEPMEES
ncbi:histone deacetylase 9-like [Tubulanus polymorphus]|uniref:histone deacetylase 9-like n=1 Tax=Tubulanus polymorphus TaxID=672921 RepID=UPI003DA523F6